MVFDCYVEKNRELKRGTSVNKLFKVKMELDHSKNVLVQLKDEEVNLKTNVDGNIAILNAYDNIDERGSSILKLGILFKLYDAEKLKEQAKA